MQFWQGAANGAAVGGAYKNWKTIEPNNTLDQDCQRIDVLDGKWADESCSGLLNYVCEGDGCPADPNKTDAGQCGCGTPDSDADADGTADCNDRCPNDATKTVPGVCGCGIADADSDGDGTFNCQDQCPSDAKKIAPGDCGCANTPRAAGTACDDGQCAANTTCDGSGTCGTPAQCGVPDAHCSFALRAGVGYWFCSDWRSFSAARQKCQAVGLDLAAIESAGEDAFIGTKTTVHTYVSGSDQASEGAWSWLATGQSFWTGNRNGRALGSAYTNWSLLQPDDTLSSNDCMVKAPPLLGGKWETRPCNVPAPYVCERIDFCPNDPNKLVPGQCGCGTPDIDSDHDGTLDCNDACASDPAKIAPGQCGCGNSDVDSDHDGTADCVDACPADPARVAPGPTGCSDALDQLGAEVVELKPRQADPTTPAGSRPTNAQVKNAARAGLDEALRVISSVPDDYTLRSNTDLRPFVAELGRAWSTMALVRTPALGTLPDGSQCSDRLERTSADPTRPLLSQLFAHLPYQDDDNQMTLAAYRLADLQHLIQCLNRGDLARLDTGLTSALQFVIQRLVEANKTTLALALYDHALPAALLVYDAAKFYYTPRVYAILRMRADLDVGIARTGNAPGITNSRGAPNVPHGVFARSDVRLLQGRVLSRYKFNDSALRYLYCDRPSAQNTLSRFGVWFADATHGGRLHRVRLGGVTPCSFLERITDLSRMGAGDCPLLEIVYSGYQCRSDKTCELATPSVYQERGPCPVLRSPR